eukprot:gene7939-9767_t
MKSNIKIVLVGDQNVGKTTMICSLVSESFNEKVQKVVPEAMIPVQFAASGGNCAIRIIDTADDSKNNKDQMDLEIKHADAIVIVYATDRFDTFMNIRIKWIPLITKLRQSLPPIVIVGNKDDVASDLKEGSKNLTQIEETIQFIKQYYPETVHWMECSAKSMNNIAELLYNAQNLVLFPESQLYHRASQTMTSGCESAFKRIFKLCDRNCDGSLDESELNYFQAKCGHESMDTDVIENLKQFVKGQIDDGVDENGFTEKGFLFMNLLFLEKGPAQHSWLSLRAFHYDDDLSISKDYLYPLVNVPKDHNVAISSEGTIFLKELFERFDRDKDGLLSRADLDLMFSTAPSSSLPFPDDFETYCNTDQDSNYLTLPGFLSLWSMLCYEDYKMVLTYFAYLGSDTMLNNTNLITFIKSREIDNPKQVTRNVFNCFVIGSKACGKSTFLNIFLGKRFSEYYSQSSGYHKLNEVKNPNEFLDGLNNRKGKCDLICLLYEDKNEESFRYALDVYEKIQKQIQQQSKQQQSQPQINYHIPVMFIKTKSDSSAPTSTPTPSSASAINTIDKFFKSNKITPKDFSIVSSNTVYHEIIETIENSGLLQQQQQQKAINSANNTKLLTMVLVGGGIAGFLAFSRFANRK